MAVKFHGASEDCSFRTRAGGVRAAIGRTGPIGPYRRRRKRQRRCRWGTGTGGGSDAGTEADTEAGCTPSASLAAARIVLLTDEQYAERGSEMYSRVEVPL